MLTLYVNKCSHYDLKVTLVLTNANVKTLVLTNANVKTLVLTNANTTNF